MTVLIAQGILHTENGKFLNEKILGVSSADCVIRFTVRNDDFSANYPKPLYQDRQIFANYTQYYHSKASDTALCYITGEQVLCTTKHRI